MIRTRPETYLDSLYFPEALRWHEGALWFSDVFGGHVLRAAGRRMEVVASIPGMPVGLGWLPDGSLLVVSCEGRRIWRVVDGNVRVYAELGAMLAFDANDMVVDRLGRAYVGNYGFDPSGQGEPSATRLVRVDTDGSVSAIGPDLMFPNGMVLFDDQRRLAIAETLADRITVAQIGRDGEVTDPVLIAVPAGSGPDGIDIDAEGALWVACAFGGEVVRVTQRGQLTDRLRFPGEAVYCLVLGGPDGRTLFVAIASRDERLAAQERTGRIVSLRVDVPRAALDRGT